MPWFSGGVPRFGVQTTRQRVLECLLHAEMYLVDTIVYFSAGKHAKKFVDLRHLRERRDVKQGRVVVHPFRHLHRGLSLDNLPPRSSEGISNRNK